MIIEESIFRQVQDVLAGRGRGPCEHKPHRAGRAYAFTGVLYCGVCERRMQTHWLNDSRYYRCRFPATYAMTGKIDHARNVCLRQDAFEQQVDSWLAAVVAPGNLQQTIDQLAVAQDAAAGNAQAELARARIEDAYLKLTVTGLSLTRAEI